MSGWAVPYPHSQSPPSSSTASAPAPRAHRFIKYLYKYLCKGSDRINISVHHSDMDFDEGENFELQRYVSATEAFARMLDISMHVFSHGVQLLTIHLPGEESVPVGDGGERDAPADVPAGAVTYVSKVNCYFMRPVVAVDRPGLAKRHMDALTMTEYFNFFQHAKTLPVALARKMAGELDEPAAAGCRRRRAASPDGEASDAEGAAGSVDSGLCYSGDEDGGPAPARRAAAAGMRGRGRGRGSGRARGRGGRGRRGGRGGGRVTAVAEHDILQDGGDVPHWVWPRSREGVSRLPVLMPTAGEVYYLRLLLLRVPARSFDDLKMVGGVMHSSFRAAAIARNIVNDGHEARQALRASVDCGTDTPAELRVMYCLFIMHLPEAGDPVELFVDFWEELSADVARPGWVPNSGRDSREGLSDGLRKVILLRRINSILRNYNKTGEAFGLPSQEQMEALLSDADRRVLGDEPSREDELRALQSPRQALAEFNLALPGLTAEQRAIVDYWVHERTAERSPQVFIDALAGRGKTHVMRVIAAWERSQGNLPLSCAFTGIVAAMHIGGVTCHRLCGLPISSDDVTGGASSITRNSEMGMLLRAGSAIICDESYMLRCAAEASLRSAALRAAS